MSGQLSLADPSTGLQRTKLPPTVRRFIVFFVRDQKVNQTYVHVLLKPKPSKSSNVLVMGFGTANRLIDRTEIKRDKNDRLCVSDLSLRSKSCINA